MKNSSAKPLAPGPKGTLILGSLGERRTHPLRLFMENALRYGPLVRFRMGPLYLHLVTHPELAKQVLQERSSAYRKGKMYEVLVPVLGRGLLTSEGEKWRKQRKLAQPAFHRQRIVGFAKTMVDATQEMLQRWEPMIQSGASFDVAQEMMRLTLGIVGRTLLGVDVSGDADQVGKAVSYLIKDANNRLLSVAPWVFDLPSPKRAVFKKNLKVLDDVVFKMIEHRRKNPSPQVDLLGMFMAARDEETGEGMSDRELRDEVMTMFLAGHETTANALSWTWYLLSSHVAVRNKLNQELDRELGGRPPTVEDLSRLKYLKAVLQESMRLFPPAWLVVRQAIQDENLGGYTVKKGSFVAVSAFVTHRLPEYWENPEGFDPERFLEEGESQRPKFAYFPFGGGPRICIGSEFAMMEAMLILVTILQRVRLDLVPGQVIEPEALITLRPKGGVQMKAVLKAPSKPSSKAPGPPSTASP